MLPFSLSLALDVDSDSQTLALDITPHDDAPAPNTARLAPPVAVHFNGTPLAEPEAVYGDERHMTLHPGKRRTRALKRAKLRQSADQLERYADQLERQVAAARAFADEMADYCSPHGIAADYARRLHERLDDAATTPADPHHP